MSSLRSIFWIVVFCGEAIVLMTVFSVHQNSRSSSETLRITGILPEGQADYPVEKLVAELYLEQNKVMYGGTVIPGGELLVFSPPMIQLIELGEAARPAVERRIRSRHIGNEAILISGAIGNKATIPLLIDAYPAFQETETWEYRRKVVCVSFALSYLTGLPFGRDRGGADFAPGNRRAFLRWWRENQRLFVVPAQKPLATWVPEYEMAMTNWAHSWPEGFETTRHSTD